MGVARGQFIDAQNRMLNRYGVDTKSEFIEVPSINGYAHVLISGEGPPLVMINGIGTPGAMFAPLMAELSDFRLHVIELPAYGLTDTTQEFTKNIHQNAVRFLYEVLEALELDSVPFVLNSLASLFTSLLALDRPGRVEKLVHIGCPAIVLDTSAPLPMRLLSVKPLGRLMTRLQPPSEKQVEQLSKMVNQYPLVPELVDLLVATESLPDFRHTFLSTLNKLLRLRGNQPKMRLTAEQLANIAQPTLIFWGKDDPFGPPQVGKRMVEMMPQAELKIIKGGHTPWLTESEVIAPVLIRFLNQIE